MNINDYQEKLNQFIDPKYQKFSSSLSGSLLPLLGIKIPLLRSLIKEVKDDKSFDPQKLKLNQYLEYNLSYLAISLERLNDIKSQMEFLSINLVYAKGWQVTDTLVSYVRKLSFKEYFPYFKDLIQSKDTFTRRFAIVLMRRFASDKDISKAFTYLKDDKEYYVEMAWAWLIADVMVYQPSQALLILKRKQLSSTIKKKATQKIRDSYRVDEELKLKASKI
jgi:3-methyladenine DNA glycosylase AlkD